MISVWIILIQSGEKNLLDCLPRRRHRNKEKIHDHINPPSTHKDLCQVGTIDVTYFISDL